MASYAAAASSPVSAYLELLNNPMIAWSARDDAAEPGRFAPDPALPSDYSARRAELELMLKTYAPRLWLHSADPIAPNDPIEFVRKSSLWLKRPWGASERVAAVGEVKPSELGSRNTGAYARNMSRFWGADGPLFSPSGFIKRAHADDRAPGSASDYSADGRVETDVEKEFFLRLEDPAQGKGEFSEKNVPMFWRLGVLPRNELARQAPKGYERVMIEYWYHVPYNEATSFGVGNHQGDWEGLAMLVDIGLGSRGKLVHKLAAVFLASHEGGQWHCPSALARTDGHFEMFSALGTHATYAAEGTFRASAITDRTNRGTKWDTWNLLRPMALEPYYGFAGHWGEPRFLPYASGPTAPGAPRKWLPNRANAAAHNLQKCEEWNPRTL